VRDRRARRCRDQFVHHYRITVSATVVAACAIAPRLPAHLGAAVADPRIACAATPASSVIVAPQPVVTVIRDATGLTTVKIEF
jgi:hypothetical protein